MAIVRSAKMAFSCCLFVVCCLVVVGFVRFHTKGSSRHEINDRCFVSCAFDGPGRRKAARARRSRRVSICCDGCRSSPAAVGAALMPDERREPCVKPTALPFPHTVQAWASIFLGCRDNEGEDLFIFPTSQRCFPSAAYLRLRNVKRRTYWSSVACEFAADRRSNDLPVMIGYDFVCTFAHLERVTDFPIIVSSSSPLMEMAVFVGFFSFVVGTGANDFRYLNPSPQSDSSWSQINPSSSNRPRCSKDKVSLFWRCLLTHPPSAYPFSLWRCGTRFLKAASCTIAL